MATLPFSPSLLSCHGLQFKKLSEQYGLVFEFGSYFPSSNRALDDSLASRVAEFDLLARARLDCVLSRADDRLEAAEVEWALEELVKAWTIRLQYEEK